MRRVIIILVCLFFIPSQIFSKGKELTIFLDYGKGESYFEKMKDLISKFEKENKVTILTHEIYFPSTDDKHDAYKKLLLNGSQVPDILEIDGIRIPEFASLGYIADVTKYFPQKEQDSFFPNAIKEVTWKDRVWGFPLFAAAGIIAYRKDILDKYKMLPPKSWRELISMAQKLRNETDYGMVAQMANYEGLMCNVLEFIWSNGGVLNFSPPVKLATPEAIEGLELMTDIINKYKLTPKDQLRYREDEGKQLFLEGRTLFSRQWTEAWLSSNYKKYTKEIPNVEIMPIPKGPSGKIGFSTLGGWALSVNKNSKNKELAIRLAKFLTDHNTEKIAMMTWSYLPARKELYSDRELLQKYPWLAKVYPIFINAKLRPRTPFYPEISEIMRSEIYLALEGKLPPKLALERAEQKISSFLKSSEKGHGR